ELPVTTEGDYWMRDNADFAARQREVAGYFGPSAGSPELDYSGYGRQVGPRTGQSRPRVHPRAPANPTKARSRYYSARDRLDANPSVTSSQKREVLANIRAIIEQQYPGWQDDILGVGASLPNDAKIERLEAAVNDAENVASPVVEPLRL